MRLPELSRRAVVVGSPASLLAAPAAFAQSTPIPVASTQSNAAAPFKRWLYLNAKIERLQTRWARLESWLAREHSWFQLSPAEQQALPWAQELRDIDGCLDLLLEKRDELLEALPTQGSAALEVIAAKLEVAERLVWAADHPEAHALISGSRQDILTLIEAVEPHH
ncbi:helicase [Phenylobacterium zucineum]|uniref:helicase n=1 Tax=Phenylobacterium zucineum TaxID=284016 RepID=UPI0011D11026|nr:helicase [Phenylobacterium zucineum]